MVGITLETIGDLIDTGHGLNAWCPACQHGAPLDLGLLAERYGRAETYIKPASRIRLRCKACGAASVEYRLAVPEAWQAGRTR